MHTKPPLAAVGLGLLALLGLLLVFLPPRAAQAAPPLKTVTITDGGVARQVLQAQRIKFQCDNDVRYRCDTKLSDGGLPLADSTSERVTVGDAYKVDMAMSDQGCSFINPDGGNFVCNIYPR